MSNANESTDTTDVLTHWIDNILLVHPVPPWPMLVSDQYYGTRKYLEICAKKNYPYLIRIQQSRISEVASKLCEIVNEPGKSAVLATKGVVGEAGKPGVVGEGFIMTYMPQARMGRRLLASNRIQAIKRHGGQLLGEDFPGENAYAYCFAECDFFNAGLKKRFWPYKIVTVEGINGFELVNDATAHTAGIQNAFHIFRTLVSPLENINWKSAGVMLCFQLYDKIVSMEKSTT